MEELIKVYLEESVNNIVYIDNIDRGKLNIKVSYYVLKQGTSFSEGQFTVDNVISAETDTISIWDLLLYLWSSTQ